MVENDLLLWSSARRVAITRKFRFAMEETSSLNSLKHLIVFNSFAHVSLTESKLILKDTDDGTLYFFLLGS
jgi:hypothetical protein